VGLVWDQLVLVKYLGVILCISGVAFLSSLFQVQARTFSSPLRFFRPPLLSFRRPMGMARGRDHPSSSRDEGLSFFFTLPPPPFVFYPRRNFPLEVLPLVLWGVPWTQLLGGLLTVASAAVAFGSNEVFPDPTCPLSSSLSPEPSPESSPPHSQSIFATRRGLVFGEVPTK